MDIEKIRVEYPEYYEIVKGIIDNAEFQRRKDYKHHGNISVYDHSLKVSLTAYKIAKKLSGDVRVVSIAGILHDFYPNPWLDNTGKILVKKTRFFKKHGFVHAREALENSKYYFASELDSKIEDGIKKHMFPLNIAFPKYKESWIITLSDKYVSLEIFKRPLELLKYVGIRKKG